MEDLKITNAIYSKDDNTVYVYVNVIKSSTLSSVTFTTTLENELENE